MRFHRLILLVAFISLSFVACEKGPGARAPWTAVDANQGIFGSIGGGVPTPSPPVVTSDKAKIAVTGIKCDPENKGYLVDVMWITTAEDVSAVRIDLDVAYHNMVECEGETGDDGMIADCVESTAFKGEPVLTYDLKTGLKEGASTYFISRDHVGSNDMGVDICARVTINPDSSNETVSTVSPTGSGVYCMKLDHPCY